MYANDESDQNQISNLCRTLFTEKISVIKIRSLTGPPFLLKISVWLKSDILLVPPLFLLKRSVWLKSDLLLAPPFLLERSVCINPISYLLFNATLNTIILTLNPVKKGGTRKRSDFLLKRSVYWVLISHIFYSILYIGVKRCPHLFCLHG